MSSFAIVTLGCKVNNYESASYREGLLAAGFSEKTFSEVADIYIINTCALTKMAAFKSKQMIHRARRNNPQAFICAVSCLVECYRKELEELEVDLLLGNSGKQNLVELIVANYQKDGPVLIPEVETALQFEELPVTVYNQTRAFLKIQDGCEQNCSYCIIPQARGKERSLAVDKVIKAAEILSRSHKEIVLTGIHTGRYGKDSGCSLTALVKELLKLPLLERLRLSSIEITEIDDELLQVMHDDRKLARHLHIPLQSGSNEILQAMKRPYSREEYLKRIKEIRKKVPRIGITADIIAGFPGESESIWEEGKAFIASCDFSFLHVFPYSARINTKAATLSDEVDGNTKRKRVRELLEYSQRQFSDFQKVFIDKEVSVLVERFKDGLSFGRCSEYLPVYINGEHPRNTLVRAWGVKQGENGLKAEVRK